MGNGIYAHCDGKPFFINNKCNVHMNGYGYVQNFCTLAGPAGNRFRHWACAQMGPEWGRSGNSGGCRYNDCNNRANIGSGCCKHPAHCCGISGAGGTCQRAHFYGDPADCCLKNSVCTRPWSHDDECSDHKHFTCADGFNGAPNHRELTGKGCRGPLRDFFLGENVDIVTTTRRWLDKTNRGVMI